MIIKYPFFYYLLFFVNNVYDICIYTMRESNDYILRYFTILISHIPLAKCATNNQ